MNFRNFAALLCALIGMLGLAGCGSDETRVAQGDREQVLHWGNGTEPQELDPHIVTGIPEHHILVALLEGLVLKNPATLEPIPGVAERWEISADGLVYTFHLRADARWSNGDPVTAGDFAWSWQRALTPSLGNSYAYMLFAIRNAEAFATGKLADFAQVGVEVLDARTLRVTLDHPTPYFLQLLDHFSMFPVHRATLEQYGDPFQRGSTWTRAGHFVGNGPFVLDQWALNKVVVAKKSPTYWDAAQVKLNAIHYYPVENVSTEERMFRAGQLHLTASIPPDKIEVYRREAPELLRVEPYLGNYFYRLNTRVPQLADPRVRRALAMSIDREQIVEHVTKGGQQPAHAFTPPDTLGYTAPPGFAHDPEAARQLLAEAGYPDGKGFPPTELLYNTSEGHRKLAVAIQQMWKRELNLEIALNNQDWKVYLDSVNNGHYQIARAGWIGDYVDPNSFLDMWVTNGGNNQTHWGDAHYDDLVLNCAPKALDRTLRHQCFREAEALLMAAMPVIPIFYSTRNYLAQPSVRGLPANLLGYPLFKQVYLAADGTPAGD